MKETIGNVDITAVGETALLTLYAKAIESQSENPILKDEKAEALVSQLDPILRSRKGKMARQLITRSIDSRLVVHLSLRALKYDTYTEAFLEKNQVGTIVNLGCGLDTRFFRVDNGRTHFFDLDLPGMIQIRRKLINENDRYQMIGQSVMDFSWMDHIEKTHQPVLFLAEGLLMYFEPKDVKRFVLELQERFPGSELVCELTNITWVEGFWGELASKKMTRRIKIDPDANFKFGISKPEDLESWHDGIKFLEQWFYMDDNHPKLGWMRILRKMKLFRTSQYTARYRLDGC